MRTTINLPDGLLAQAKKEAADSGSTLTDFIAEAIRLSLASKRKQIVEAPPLPVYSPPPGQEGLQPGVDLDNSAALWDLMDEADGTFRR
jgi:hypothetical protein